MDLGLTGKRALVLAGSAGLGFAVARQLSLEGARVTLCSRDLNRARSAAAEIAAETGGTVAGEMADVADASSLERLFASTVATMGGLDVLVCNAGGPPPGGFKSLAEESWDHAYQLTLMSVVRSVRLALPHFTETGGGSVLVLGSSSVKQPIPNLLLSNVFRPAIHGLVKHLTEELAPAGVRVNMLSPGRVLTGRIEQLDAAQAKREDRSVEEVRADSVGRIPLGRLGTPEEFGKVAAFMVSDAASYLTGSSLLVDGGMVRAL
ncbi:MAG TPA: SDR family oxidoreductase, partial [Trueperaceae bacterium]|nr:SDR family oxidoreductase [Trueperaceae bacterium]